MYKCNDFRLSSDEEYAPDLVLDFKMSIQEYVDPDTTVEPVEFKPMKPAKAPVAGPRTKTR